MVNRRWHSICATFKLHRLVAVDRCFGDNLIRWYDSNLTIREEERCGPEMFGRLTEKPLLSNLKHLALSDDPSEFELNKLNRFRHLAFT